MTHDATYWIEQCISRTRSAGGYDAAEEAEEQLAALIYQAGDGERIEIWAEPRDIEAFREAKEEARSRYIEVWTFPQTTTAILLHPITPDGENES